MAVSALWLHLIENELQKNIISNSAFKLFLELEVQLRDAITKFHDSKYANCLSILDELKDNFLLDLYLAQHVHVLYTNIRNRALIQYFSPYLSADMNKMSIAFNTSVSSLEDELMHLILEGTDTGLDTIKDNQSVSLLIIIFDNCRRESILITKFFTRKMSTKELLPSKER